MKLYGVNEHIYYGCPRRTREREKEPESLLKAIKIKIPGNYSSLETEMDTQIKELKEFQNKKKRRNQRSPQMTYYD